MTVTAVVTVDRVEGDYYVCVAEDGKKTYDVPRTLGDARVNDLLALTLQDGEIVSFTRDSATGQARAEENLSRLHALFNRKK